MAEARSSAPMQVTIPAIAPRTGSALGRWFGRTILRLGGWRITGAFPAEARVVIIAAPHSSAWDAVWGLAAKLAMSLKIEFMAKHELFWWPLGPLLRSFGAIPTDRHSAHGVVGDTVARFAQREVLWLVLAPEGTRRRVEHWRSGFWHIARDAGVPVVCVYFHYPERTIGVGPTLAMSGDRAADMARVRAFYAPWQGKRRGTT